MTSWSNFFVAIASAAAALTGLIFVGVSISLAKILSIPRLPGRAFQALFMLLALLVVSLLCLIPGQSANTIGIEVLAIGIIMWPLILKNEINMFRNTDAAYKRQYLLNIVFSQLAVLPYLASGVIILRTGYDGIYWLVPGIICSFIKAVVDAWVLLVEIHR